MSEPDVREIRRNIKLSQTEFALAFGLELTTVRAWEQGLRRPNGPARMLMILIDRIPDVVMAALRDSKPVVQKM